MGAVWTLILSIFWLFGYCVMNNQMPVLFVVLALLLYGTVGWAVIESWCPRRSWPVKLLAVIVGPPAVALVLVIELFVRGMPALLYAVGTFFMVFAQMGPGPNPSSK